jgi:hypothetical protein
MDGGFALTASRSAKISLEPGCRSGVASEHQTFVNLTSRPERSVVTWRERQEIQGPSFLPLSRTKPPAERNCPTNLALLGDWTDVDLSKDKDYFINHARLADRGQNVPPRCPLSSYVISVARFDVQPTTNSFWYPAAHTEAIIPVGVFALAASRGCVGGATVARKSPTPLEQSETWCSIV